MKNTSTLLTHNTYKILKDPIKIALNHKDIQFEDDIRVKQLCINL